MAEEKPSDGANGVSFFAHKAAADVNGARFWLSRQKKACRKKRHALVYLINRVNCWTSCNRNGLVGYQVSIR